MFKEKKAIYNKKKNPPGGGGVLSIKVCFDSLSAFFFGSLT